MSRLLGIDLGQRRIGIAISDDANAAARPLATISRKGTADEDAAVVARIAAEQRAGELIVGLPLSLDGSHGPQAEDSARWAAKVASVTGLPVSLRDERLTTQRAASRVGPPGRGPAGGPPGPRRRHSQRVRLDREAATLILQAELDARRSGAA